MDILEIDSFDAKAFVESVRETQRANGKALFYCHPLSADALSFISDSTTEMKEELLRLGITQNDIIRMMTLFEEMCRLQKRPLTNDMRYFLIRHLAQELSQNHKGIYNPGMLVSITAYNGAIVESLTESFPLISSSRRDFWQVLTRHPFRPREFLEKATSNLIALIEESKTPDSKLAVFANRPKFFRSIVIRHSKDPRDTVLHIIETTKRLVAESQNKNSELAFFADAPGFIGYAVINNVSNSRESLLKHKRTAIKLYEDSKNQDHEFALFSDAPEIFYYAIIHHNSDPLKFLRRSKERVLATIDESKDPHSSFAFLADKPKILKRFAVSFICNYHRLERDNLIDGIEETAEVLAEESKRPGNEFCSFANAPLIFRIAGIICPDDPRKLLREVLRGDYDEQIPNCVRPLSEPAAAVFAHRNNNGS
ncbi:MAG: hypothetical protein WC464_09115 [Bdellovibrionales bacterium]